MATEKTMVGRFSSGEGTRRKLRMQAPAAGTTTRRKSRSTAARRVKRRSGASHFKEPAALTQDAWTERRSNEGTRLWARAPVISSSSANPHSKKFTAQRKMKDFSTRTLGSSPTLFRRMLKTSSTCRGRRSAVLSARLRILSMVHGGAREGSTIGGGKRWRREDHPLGWFFGRFKF